MHCHLDEGLVGCAVLALYDSIGEGVKRGDERCAAVRCDLLDSEGVTCSRRHQHSVGVLITKEGSWRCDDGGNVNL